MSLSLVTISDGTTADAADVNQYKTAIETLAGAGWDDGAGDLDVEELSDAVKTPGDGLDYSGGNLVVDVSDFAGSGLEDDGSNDLRIAAAAAGDGLQGGAGSALAVDVSDFAGAGLEDDGSENLRIAAAAAGAGLTGGGGSALAVGAGDGIAVAADSVAVDLDGGANDGLEFSGGKLTCSAATTSAKGVVELATNGEEAAGVVVQGNDTRLLTTTQIGDLTDGGITTLHDHEVYAPLYVDSTQGGGDGVAAAALPTYAFQNPGTTGAHDEIKVRCAFYNSGHVDYLYLTFEAYLSATPPGSAVATIEIDDDGTNDDTTITATSWEREQVELDISSQTAGVYEITVTLRWANSLDNSDNTILYMRHVEILSKERSE